MNHTTNINLPQWEATDQIKRTDFNAAMSAIDVGVAAAAAAAAGGTKIATGTYTGNGAATRTISLSFTPKLVFVFGKYLQNASLRLGHLFISSGIVRGYYFNSPYSYCVEPASVAVTANGFQVTVEWGNISDTSFNYIAIG